MAGEFKAGDHILVDVSAAEAGATPEGLALSLEGLAFQRQGAPLGTDA